MKVYLDFSIECNDGVLKSAKFTVKRKQLLFTSPPKPEGKDELHLIIKRKEYIKNTATLEEYELHEDYLPYVTHGKDKPMTIIVIISLYHFSFRFR